MAKARVHFPIKLTVDPGALQGDAIERTAATLAGLLAGHLATAAGELRADGLTGAPRLAGIAFEWSGDRRRAFDERERRAIEKRLNKLVVEAIGLVVPPPVPTQPFTIDRLEFLAPFRGLVVLLADTQAALVDDLRVRYRDQLDDKVAAVAWVATVHAPVAWQTLYWTVRDQRDQQLGDDTLFAYFWDGQRVDQLRALDRRHLRALPSLRDQEALAPPSAARIGTWQVPAGVRVVFLAAKLPELDLEDYLRLGAIATVQLTFADLLMLPEIAERLAQLFQFGDAFPALLELYGDQPLRIHVLPFAVRRKISADAVRKHVTERAREDSRRAEQLGELTVLTPATEASLPDEIVAPAHALGGKPAVPDPLHPDQDWPPGVRGVFYYPFVGDQQMANRVLFAGKWISIQLDADATIHALDLENGFLSAPRHDAIWKWAHTWQNASPELFDLLLLALDRRGALGRLFDAWLDENLYPVTLRPLIALSIRSRYRRHPKLLDIIAKLERWQGGLLLHEYDVDQQRIRLFGSSDRDDWILAAGDSDDPSRGVVAETSSYYSETGKVMRPKPATLEKLSEPVRRKVGDLIARTVCAGDETRTEDELIAEAIREASKELGLGKSDFEPASIRSSLRVLRLERRRTGGVDDIYVHYHEVHRFEGDRWEKAGEIQVKPALAFEAALRLYHLQHLMAALTVGVALVAVIGTGVALVVIGIATVGEIIVAIVLSEAVYLWTNRHEGYTLTGFLFAAWIGELELLGFKGLGKALGLIGKVGRSLTAATATRLLGEAGAETLTSAVLRSSATRWIAFALRAGVTGVEFGALSALDLLANDLFHMTRCKGMSSSEEYWSRFKVGLVIGAGMELIAIPALAPIARALKDKASTMLEAAKLLRETGKSFPEITRLLLQGSEQIEAALGRTLDNPGVTGPLARGFRQRMLDVARTYGREYETRAYRSLVQFIDRDLSAAASKGLTRVLEASGQKQLDQLLASLARGKVAPSELLDLLSLLDEDAMAELVKSGNLTRLGDAPSLLAFLRRHPQAGWRLLGDVFGNAVDDLESYLARFAKADPMLVDNAASILLRRGNQLPRKVVADLILANRGITRTQLPLLDRLFASRVRLDAFAEGTAPTLPDFEKAFGELTPAEQTYVLGGNAGRTPRELLEHARRTRARLKESAEILNPTPEQLAEQIKTGERAQSRQRIIATHRTGGYQTSINISVLRENVRELARMRKAIVDFAPDAIVGTERGGVFVAEAATSGDAALTDRLLRLPKGDFDQVVAQGRAQIEAMIASGKRRFVFTDVYFSGSGYNKLQKDLIGKLADAYPECEFRGMWLRESLGFEEGVTAGEPILRRAKKAKFTNVVNDEFKVTFAIGDDAARLLESAGAEPIFLFDDAGVILRVVEPRAGERTRDALLRLLREWTE